jgi:hypothetical protein
MGPSKRGMMRLGGVSILSDASGTRFDGFAKDAIRRGEFDASILEVKSKKIRTTRLMFSKCIQLLWIRINVHVASHLCRPAGPIRPAWQDLY